MEDWLLRKDDHLEEHSNNESGSLSQFFSHLEFLEDCDSFAFKGVGGHSARHGDHHHGDDEDTEDADCEDDQSSKVGFGGEVSIAHCSHRDDHVPESVAVEPERAGFAVSRERGFGDADRVPEDKDLSNQKWRDELDRFAPHQRLDCEHDVGLWCVEIADALGPVPVPIGLSKNCSVEEPDPKNHHQTEDLVQVVVSLIIVFQTIKPTSAFETLL